MPPQSRGGPLPTGRFSVSTPNLPALNTVGHISRSTLSPIEGTPTSTINANRPPSPTWTDTPSEPVSIDDLNLESTTTTSSQALSGSDSSSSSDDEDEDQTPMSRMPLRPSLLSTYSKSQTYLSSAAFAPPFYNRPPTPLPPSPSLTSLLRPAFSTSASRPTTPDHSSDDGTSTRAASVTRAGAAASTLTTSFRTAQPIPRASPKVPTYEYYGFTLYLTSGLAFVMYVLWSFLPSPFLHQLGIYYYPNRWWSVALPAWLVMLVVWIFAALAGYNTGHLTVGMERIEAFVDEAAQVAAVDARGRIKGRPRRGTLRGNDRRERRKTGAAAASAAVLAAGTRQADGLGLPGPGGVEEVDWKAVWSEGTDAVMDIPIGGVCEVLYGEGRERDDYFD